MRLGVYVYGLATVAAGIFDLVWGDFDASHHPIQAFGDHIPGRELFAYITAVWMVAGGVAILWRRTAKSGAVALAVIYFIFAVFWFPRFYTAPHFLGVRPSVYIGVLGGVGTQLIAVAAGALVYASYRTSGFWPNIVHHQSEGGSILGGRQFVAEFFEEIEDEADACDGSVRGVIGRF